MKAGDKVELIDDSFLSGLKIFRELKKGGVYTIERVKPTGGLILKETEHPVNIFGNQQGIMKNCFRVVRYARRKKK